MIKFLWPARNILRILNESVLINPANVMPVFRFSPHVFKHGDVIEVAANLILPSCYLSKKKKWNIARSEKQDCRVVGAPLLIRIRWISRSKMSRPPKLQRRMALRLVKMSCCEDSFLTKSDRIGGFSGISGYNELLSVRIDFFNEYRTK